jgi:DNA-binding MarR family transcriptional regulator
VTEDACAPAPRSVGWAIARLARYFEVALSELDLSPVQYRILLTLAQGPESSKSLAERLTVSTANTSVVVDGLVQRGAVRKTQSPIDRRRVSVALTPDGTLLLEEAELAVTARLLDIASYFPQSIAIADALESLTTWNAALDPFRTHWLARESALRLNKQPDPIRNGERLPESEAWHPF